MTRWENTTLGCVCRSVSETYHGQDSNVVLVNTSDVFEGEILAHEYVPNVKLRGQFKKTFQKDDILFSEIRPANKRYAYVTLDDTRAYIASTKLMVLRANREKIIPRYLYSFLKSEQRLAELQHLAETRSGTFPQITFDAELAPLKIILPAYDTQKKIVDIISVFDDKIALNRKINKNLEEQAQAIFYKYFIYISDVPTNWQEANLTNIAEYRNGLAMQKFRPQKEEKSLPVLKIKELRQGHCDLNSERCSLKIKPEYIIHDGDVIFSWSGSLLVDFWCGGTCGLNQHLFKVYSKEYEPWLYYSWTKYHLTKFISMAADRATTMGHIKRDALEQARVLIPCHDDYLEIGRLLQPLYDSMISNRVEIRKLSKLRDTLLPRLMSGELDVSNIEL